MLPALPTGMHSASRSPSRSSCSSNAAVFCPSMRNSLTELTSTIGCVSVSWRTSSSAWSKFPASEITRAPWISVCASLPCAILPSGTITAQVMPARAAYAAALAAVLPVEAQITALAPSRTAAETAQVMPRSLNDPVGLAPSSFRRTVAPTSSESTGATTTGVEPSCRLTTGSPGANGKHPGAVGHLDVQVEGALDIVDQLDRERRRRWLRAPGHHADDVAEHRAGGLRPARAGTRHRDLGDRSRLNRDGVERSRNARER